MIRDPQSTSISTVHEHVARVHHAKKRLNLKTALFAGLAILAIGMVIAMIVDARLNLFSHTVRTLLTIGTIAVSAVGMWLLFVRARRRNHRRVSAAQEIDTTYPVLQERVTTLTSCEEDFDGSQRLVHPAMLRKVSEETAAMHRSVEPRPIVSRRPLFVPLLGLGLAALFFFGMLVLDAPKTLVQLGRFWAPWSDLSVTQVESTKGDHVTARGEPMTLTASLSGRPVEEVFVKTRAADRSSSASERLWPSTKDRTLAHYRQPSAKQSFDYRFRAGDGQTDWHRVTVADRPKIDELVLRITPPAYTGRPAQEFRRLPKKLRTVVGSEMEVVLKPLAPIRTARVVTGKTHWLPMEQSKDATYQCSTDLVSDLQFEVQLTERYGLQNRRPPRCRLQVVPDKAPQVKILKPTADALVLPDETIDIHYLTTDDFAVESMELRVYTHRDGEAKPSVHAQTIPIKPEQNRKRIKGVVQLDLDQFKLKDGDSISYEVVARDNYVVQDESEKLVDAKPIRPSETQGDDKTLGDGKNKSDTSPAIAANSPSKATQVNKNESPAAFNPRPSEPSVATERRPPSSQSPNLNQTNRNNRLADNQGSPPVNRQSDSTGTVNSAQQSSAQQPNSMVAKDAEAQQGSPASNKTAGNASPRSAASPAGKNDKNPKVANKDNDSPQKPGQSDRQKLTAQQMAENSQQEPSAASSPPSESAIPNRATAQSAQNSPSMAQNSNQNASPKANATGQSPVKPLPAQREEGTEYGGPADAEDKNDDQQLADNSEEPKEDSEGKPSSAEEPVEMVMRKLDVGQSSSSGQRKMKVDSYVGGYESEQRIKLELAIAPTLAQLKSLLTKAGNHTSGVMKDQEEGKAFADRHDRALSSATNNLKTASDAVLSLKRKTDGTPYAFIGLKLESIRLSDVASAYTNVRDALRVEGDKRQEHVSIASHHIARALASLAELTDEFVEVKREHQLADKMIKFKKMHRVFIENAMASLAKSPGALNRQQREAAEFDLDEEYLERLREVLEMRRDMMAELARILGDDPQLLRRYMNSIKSRSRTIRDQLTLLARAQTGISERVSNWAIVTSNAPKGDFRSVEYSFIATAHLANVRDLANELADISDRFFSWLPLEDDVERGDVATAMQLSKRAGSKLTEMVTGIDAIRASGGLQGDYQAQLAPLAPKAVVAKQALKKMDQMLRRIANDARRPELANNALRRLKELREFRFRFEQWTGKLELFAEGKAHEVLAIDQENARDDLLEYVIKIAGLESQLAGALRQDGLPAPMAKKTKALLAMLDVELPALQLTAAQSLRDDDQAESLRLQSKLVEVYESAQVLFDEVLQSIADELDKLPPNDPIASLLNDPTLDELLAQLENEQDFLEELGLTARPSNLQIISDWMKNGSGGGGGMSAMLRRMMAEQQRMRRLSNRAMRNALAETDVKGPRKRNKRAKEDRRWDLLMGQLREDMLQGDNKIPPERYRKAINEYFRQISKMKEDAE